jgi:hypothetical protein
MQSVVILRERPDNKYTSLWSANGETVNLSRAQYNMELTEVHINNAAKTLSCRLANNKTNDCNFSKSSSLWRSIDKDYKTYNKYWSTSFNTNTYNSGVVKVALVESTA